MSSALRVCPGPGQVECDACQGRNSTAMAGAGTRSVVSMAYILHRNRLFAIVSRVTRLPGRLALDGTGVDLMDEIVSAEGDKQPNRTPDLRVTTDITRCGRTLVAILSVVAAEEMLQGRYGGFC